MLSQIARAGAQKIVHPLGAGLARAGVSPDVVTVVGTLSVVIASFTLAARGYLIAGTIVITICALFDMLDGAIARATGRSSKWGAFLDSTMDRLADGAVFGCLAYWLATEHRFSAMAGAIAALLTGAAVSYAKARAEGLGFECNVGFAGRTERLIIVGVGAVLSVVWTPVILDVALWILVALATITIGQRAAVVYRQAADA
ncbi:MAG: CDP-alcohol phosphatidyltransferase family protein [Corynebacteriales bacterium]|nr:CDP-alcohol phosphatidyltransferase family protein [Mycobacteriales bacterium]